MVIISGYPIVTFVTIYSVDFYVICMLIVFYNMQQVIRVIIPAYNEEKSVKKVINAIPTDWVAEVIVVDNASTDNTYEVIKNAGATALQEMRKGYHPLFLVSQHHQLEEV